MLADVLYFYKKTIENQLPWHTPALQGETVQAFSTDKADVSYRLISEAWFFT